MLLPAAPVRRLRLSRRSLLTLFGAMVLALAARSVLLDSVDVVVLAAGATAVAGLLHPVSAALGRRMPRPAALVATLALVAGSAGLLVASVVGAVRSETARLKRVLPEAAMRLETSDRIGKSAREFGLTQRVRDVLDALPGRLSGGSGAKAVTTNAGRGATILAGAVLTIFLLLYGPRLVAAGPRVLRRAEWRDRVSSVAARAYGRAWRYAWVRLGVASASGLAGYLMCRVFDVPGGVVLGAVIGLGSLVPGVGIMVAGVPVVLLTAGLHGNGVLAFLVLLALQVLETVVVQRRLSRRVLTVGPAPSLVAALLGFEAGGLGLALLGLAAVVAAASVMAEVAPG